jgi:hypothetical protein
LAFQPSAVLLSADAPARDLTRIVMLEIGFFLFLVLLFYGAGRLLLYLTHLQFDQSQFTVPSCVGLVAVTVAATWFYKSGCRLAGFFWITIIVTAVFLLLLLIFERRQLIRTVKHRRLEIVAMAIFSFLLLLPGLLGGEQFVIFRGNYHDSFNYLEAAITYQKLPYYQVSHSNITDLVRLGFSKFGQDNLRYRPEIAILYDGLSLFSPGDFLRLHYTFLVYFCFLALCSVRLLASALLPSQKLTSVLLAGALVGGFWGQYILDIDAWSQIACMPILVLNLLLLLRLIHPIDSQKAPAYRLPVIMLYAVLWIGMFYLYPEAAVFLVPAHLFCFIIAAGFFRLRPNWSAAGIVVLSIFGFLAPVLDNNVAFLKDQAEGSFSSVTWWTYFQAFLGGNNGLKDGPLANAVDFIAGILGIYFSTPGPWTNPLVAVAVRFFILAGLAFLLIHLAHDLRSRAKSPDIFIAAYLAVSLLFAVGFCALHQYWTAGKALSYIAYTLLLLLLTPALRKPSSQGSVASRFAKFSVHALLVLQLGFLLYRPIAALQPLGIHFPPPYPAVMDPRLKQTINFADWSCLHELQRGDRVSVQIDDPVIQLFVRMLLLSHHVSFYLEPPAFSRSSRAIIVPLGPGPKTNARLTVTQSTSGQFANRLSLVRAAPNP